jgi:hypothetical protein
VSEAQGDPKQEAGDATLETEEVVTVDVEDDGTVVVDDLVAEVDAQGNVIAADELTEVDLPDGTVIVDETFSVADDEGELTVIDEETEVVSPKDSDTGGRRSG